MSYSCNDNQNYFTEAGRTTSKVLRPPGGKFDLFGGLNEIMMPSFSPPALPFTLFPISLTHSGGSSINLAYDAPENNSQNNYVSANLARRNRKNQEVTGKIGAPAQQQQQQQHYNAPQGYSAAQAMGQAQVQTGASYASNGNVTHNRADHNHNHLGLNVGGNAFASGANQNCGNVITDRSSTRIHAPPGGHSSITFG
jgi:hypothetical protein